MITADLGATELPAVPLNDVSAEAADVIAVMPKRPNPPYVASTKCVNTGRRFFVRPDKAHHRSARSAVRRRERLVNMGRLDNASAARSACTEPRRSGWFDATRERAALLVSVGWRVERLAGGSAGNVNDRRPTRGAKNQEVPRRAPLRRLVVRPESYWSIVIVPATTGLVAAFVKPV